MEKLTSLPFISIIIPAKNEEKLIRIFIIDDVRFPVRRIRTGTGDKDLG